MGKKKVVLDTNILISALGWKGNPRTIFRKVVDGEIELFISPEQFDELSRVLDYPKFQFTHIQKERFKALVLEIASVVTPTERINVVKKDPDDDRILECAITGDVDYIISGDNHLLNLKEFRGIKIITARKFLELTD